MELLGALIGVGVLAAAPTVPVLRSVVKAAVKGGLAVAGVTVAVAEVVGHQAGDLASHIRSDHASETIVDGEAVSEAPPPLEPVEEAAEAAEADAGKAAEVGAEATAAGASATAGLRPAAKSAVKSGMAVVGAAKSAAGVAAGAAGAAVVAGKQQLGGLAGGKKSETADEDAGSEPSEPQAEAEPAVADDAPAAADDLTRVLGVGPKTAVLLNNAGITSFAQLAATPVEELQAILDEAGPRYRVIDPATWPEQAQELMNTPEPEPEPFDDSDLLPILRHRAQDGEPAEGSRHRHGVAVG